MNEQTWLLVLHYSYKHQWNTGFENIVYKGFLSKYVLDLQKDNEQKVVLINAIPISEDEYNEFYKK